MSATLEKKEPLKVVEKEEGGGRQCRQLLKKAEREEAGDEYVRLSATVGNL